MKISEKLKTRLEDIEFKEKWLKSINDPKVSLIKSEKMKEYKNRPEVVLKISEKTKEYFSDEKNRKNHSNIMKNLYNGDLRMKQKEGVRKYWEKRRLNESNL